MFTGSERRVVQCCENRWSNMLRSRLAKTYLCFGNYYKLIFKSVGVTLKQSPKDLNFIGRTLILKRKK